MTLLGPILIAGFLSLAIYLGMSDSSVQNVVVVDEAKLVTKSFNDTDQIKFFYTNEVMSDSAFGDSPYNLMLIVNEYIIENNKAHLYYKKYPSVTVQSYVNNQLDNALEQIKLEMFDIDDETYAEIRTAITLGVFDYKDQAQESRKVELAAVGFLARITEVLAAQGFAVNVVSAYHHDHLYIQALGSDGKTMDR